MAGIITAYRILNKIKPELHGSGHQTRDFIYVFDTIDAITKLFKVIEKGESVNVSTDNCIQIKDLLEKIIKFYDYLEESKKLRSADVFLI